MKNIFKPIFVDSVTIDEIYSNFNKNVGSNDVLH